MRSSTQAPRAGGASPPAGAPRAEAAPLPAPRGGHGDDRLVRAVLEVVSAAGHPASVVSVPARPGSVAPWPGWTPSVLRDGLARGGIHAPWRHQVVAAEHLWAGRSTVVATGTASGKSLAYLLPVVAALVEDRRATALYLAPTKALAHDQHRVLVEAGLSGPTDACVLDGDTPPSTRDWARAHGRLLLSNPDLLHASLLPGHPRWERFLRRLSFVVVDECHHYRGVFGSHVALTLRRLARLARRSGAAPTFALASATVADPGATAALLVGRPVSVVSDDTSPRAPVDLVVTVPDGGDHTAVRALLAALVAEDARTLAFVRSRRGAEQLALGVRAELTARGDPRGRAVAAYRSGLLPEERRQVERDLQSGRLLGVATTNALELGVDITGLDAVVLAGFPGTMASLRQQVGRAGRDGRRAVAVLVARADPLDRYLAARPETLLDRPVEQVVLDPSNPAVLVGHLAAAVSEAPWTDGDTGTLAPPAAEADALAALAAQGWVRRRAAAWHRTARRPPSFSLRSGLDDGVTIVLADTGQVLGTVDAAAADRTVHAGAVYLHAGETFTIEALDREDRVALAHRNDPGWATYPRSITELTVEHVEAQAGSRLVRLGVGKVRWTSQVVSYVRRTPDGALLGEHPLDLPARSHRTTAVWFAIAADALSAAGLDDVELPGALHGAEHAMIGLLPLLASCDRWDIGGLSTPMHPDTGQATIFVSDAAPGGAGIAGRGFAAAATWVAATLRAVATCPCEAGCPACVQSPKCGNGNSPLSKCGALHVLEMLLPHLGDQGAVARPGD